MRFFGREMGSSISTMMNMQITALGTCQRPRPGTVGWQSRAGWPLDEVKAALDRKRAKQTRSKDSLSNLQVEVEIRRLLVMRRTLFVLISFLALTLGVFTRTPACARSDGLMSASETDSELDSIVVERLAFYAAVFPEILFVALPAGDAWLTSFASFLALLGNQAHNLDYEHPSHLREHLLYVTKARMQAMLRAGESSSSLFQVGADGIAERKYLCAITVNPTGVASDDDVATSHLLGVFRDDASRYTVQKNQRLDHRHHLAYVIDHEIFHCLDALYNRPIPMSSDERTTKYFHFLNENGADVFALAMHLRRHGQLSEFPARLSYIRGLSLFWRDPGHFTYDSTRQMLERENDDLTQMSVRDILALAASIRDQVAQTFDDYVAFELAASEVADLLKEESDMLCREQREKQSNDRGISIADRLLSVSCVCYARVFGPLF